MEKIEKLRFEIRLIEPEEELKNQHHPESIIQISQKLPIIRSQYIEKSRNWLPVYRRPSTKKPSVVSPTV